MSIFQQSRTLFARIRAAFGKDTTRAATNELERALDTLVTAYNTANWENRFVVGGATEILLCAWLRALGFQCASTDTLRTDLVINGVAFSVKTNFARSSTIRLVNVLGASTEATWQEPTLLLLGGEGLFYLDPGNVGANAVTRVTDAVVLRLRAVHNLRGTPWHLPLKVPVKPQQPTAVKTASHDVARAVLQTIGSQHLLSYLP